MNFVGEAIPKAEMSSEQFRDWQLEWHDVENVLVISSTSCVLGFSSG
jgi:hypothetical protein